MSKRMFCIGFALIALCSISAQATPIVWYLQGVNFSDGSTVSGSFVYDVDTNTYSNISITTTTGSTVTANTFAFADPGVANSSVLLFVVTLRSGSLSGKPVLVLNFSSALTDAGGTVPLTVSSFFGVCNNSSCNAISDLIHLAAGVVTTTPPGSGSYYFTTYYSNANTANAPDATIRAVNDGDNGGDLYASIYVFDDSEELTQCCSCVITPDGLLSESVNLNLTADPITGIKPTRGVIKIISSLRESDVNTHFQSNIPYPGIRAWATHVQKLTSGFAVSETPFANSNLTLGPSGEQGLLQALCYYDYLLSGKPCTCTAEDQDF